MSFLDLWTLPAVFAVAVLTGTGVGGGGLLVLYLTVFFGTEQIKAQWLNLVFFISVSLTAVPYHLSKRRVSPGILALFVILGIPGMAGGYLLRRVLPGDVLRRIFGGFLTAAGAIAFGKRGEVRGEEGSRRE